MRPTCSAYPEGGTPPDGGEARGHIKKETWKGEAGAMPVCVDGHLDALPLLGGVRGGRVLSPVRSGVREFQVLEARRWNFIIGAPLRNSRITDFAFTGNCGLATNQLKQSLCIHMLNLK